MRAPTLVQFTDHAEERIARRRLSRRQIAEVVLAEHSGRRHNPREADWIVSGRGVEIAYNWPDRGDETIALVVTVWSE